MFAEALSEYGEVLNLVKGVAPVEASVRVIMAQAFARWGKKDEALTLLAEISGQAVSSCSIAGVYGALGETDKAFEMLDKAYLDRDMQLVSLLVDPTLDELRGDPRFADLARRVGLPVRIKI